MRGLADAAGAGRGAVRMILLLREGRRVTAVAARPGVGADAVRAILDALSAHRAIDVPSFNPARGGSSPSSPPERDRALVEGAQFAGAKGPPLRDLVLDLVGQRVRIGRDGTAWAGCAGGGRVACAAGATGESPGMETASDAAFSGGGSPVLYYCAYTWQPHTTYEKMAQRFLEHHEAGLHRPDRWRGLYSLAGGGAGFLLVEVDHPRELTEMLQRYKDLVSWDVRSIYELDHPTVLEHMRQIRQGAK